MRECIMHTCFSTSLSLSLSLNLSTAAFVESVSQRAMSQVVRGSRVARIKIKGRSIMLFKQERIGKQQETPDRHVLSIVFSMDPPFVVPLFTIFSLRVPSFKIDVKMISFPFHFIVLFENVFNPLSNRSWKIEYFRLSSWQLFSLFMHSLLFQSSRE